jgi:hypothetical protein
MGNAPCSCYKRHKVKCCSCQNKICSRCLNDRNTKKKHECKSKCCGIIIPDPANNTHTCKCSRCNKDCKNEPYTQKPYECRGCLDKQKYCIHCQTYVHPDRHNCRCHDCKLPFVKTVLADSLCSNCSTQKQCTTCGELFFSTGNVHEDCKCPTCNKPMRTLDYKVFKQCENCDKPPPYPVNDAPYVSPVQPYTSQRTYSRRRSAYADSDSDNSDHDDYYY